MNLKQAWRAKYSRGARRKQRVTAGVSARKPGEPSPFAFGARAVGRYFRVTKECAQAARLKLISGGKG